MPRRRQSYHLYTVMITIYASSDIAQRVRQGVEHITQPEQLSGELAYSGSSEQKAAYALYRAARRAMANPLAIDVVIEQDGKVLVRVDIERRTR